MSRRRGPPALTKEQRALFDAEPGLAEEAARAAQQGMGEACFRHLSWEEMVSIATLGAMEATATFDPTSGSTYRMWAFFAAVHRVLDAARWESHRHSEARALLRAAVIAHFQGAQTGVEIGVDTAETLTRKLHGFTNPVVSLALLEVAAATPTAGGEDEIAERDAAAKAGDALREVLPPRGSEERRMLEMHFAQRMPLTEVAAAMGVDARGYRTFVRRFHEVLAAVRDGLEERGIREMPPWQEGISGEALEEAGEEE